MPYSVRVEDFHGFQDEWQKLLPSCSTDTIFVTPSWQSVWWRHFGEGSELHILSVRDGDEIIGIAPLMLRGGAFSFLGDSDLFDYHDFLILRGREPEFFDSILDYVLDLDWHALALVSLPQASRTLSHLPAIAEKRGLVVEVTPEDMAPVAVLPSLWEEYLGGLSKRDRHELRRKLRRLENADSPRQYVCEDPATLPDYMREFFRLLAASSPEKATFLTPERQSFFNDIALDLAPRGQFRLYFLELNGVQVASCICFDYGDSYLLYNSGYDPDYASLSVGLLNTALCLREAIERGKHSFQFLRGTERYKYDLGGTDQAIYKLVVRR